MAHMSHKQVYLNDFHRQNSENCLMDQKLLENKTLTVEEVIEQSKKQGRTIKILKHGSN
jgi:translation elongation factor EF-Ts